MNGSAGAAELHPSRPYSPGAIPLCGLVPKSLLEHCPGQGIAIKKRLIGRGQDRHRGAKRDTRANESAALQAEFFELCTADHRPFGVPALGWQGLSGEGC